MKIIPALLSVALHASILISCQPKRFPPKPLETSVSNQEPQQGAETIYGLESGNGLTCKNRYRGIGVMAGWGGTISFVAPNGPADQAGLRVGDEIETSQMFSHYNIGEEISVEIKRESIPMVFKVKINDVCFE